MQRARVRYTKISVVGIRQLPSKPCVYASGASVAVSPILWSKLQMIDRRVLCQQGLAKAKRESLTTARRQHSAIVFQIGESSVSYAKFIENDWRQITGLRLARSELGLV